MKVAAAFPLWLLLAVVVYFVWTKVLRKSLP